VVVFVIAQRHWQLRAGRQGRRFDSGLGRWLILFSTFLQAYEGLEIGLVGDGFGMCIFAGDCVWYRLSYEWYSVGSVDSSIVMVWYGIDRFLCKER
jgi:hypothetical protein